MTDFVEIDRMTFREYRLKMKAYRLRQLDAEYMIALSAWQHREVGAQKKKGKKLEAVYKEFGKFFNHKEREEEILFGAKKKEKEKPHVSGMIEYMRKKANGQL